TRYGEINAARARGGRFASVSSNEHRKLKRLRSGYGLRQNSRIGAFKNEGGGTKEPGKLCQVCRPLLLQSGRDDGNEPARLYFHGLDELGHRNSRVGHAAGEAPFVVVPGKHADQLSAYDLRLRQV